jgi:aspartate aminotransferase-like enzyme
VRARIERLAVATRAGAHELGLALFPEAPSPSLTALRAPEGIDGQKWRSEMEKAHGVIAMGGQDRLKGKIVRLGHMGAIANADAEESIRALGLSLESLRPGFLAPAAIERAAAATRKALA